MLLLPPEHRQRLRDRMMVAKPPLPYRNSATSRLFATPTRCRAFCGGIKPGLASGATKRGRENEMAASNFLTFRC
jgi:hypothetical protein